MTRLQIWRLCLKAKEKLWNMKETIIPIIFSGLRKIPKYLEKRMVRLEIRGSDESFQTPVLPRLSRIFRREEGNLLLNGKPNPFGQSGRIHQLYLCGGVRLLFTSVRDITLNFPIVKQQFWNSVESGVPLNFHYSTLIYLGPRNASNRSI